MKKWIGDSFGLLLAILMLLGFGFFLTHLEINISITNRGLTPISNVLVQASEIKKTIPIIHSGQQIRCSLNKNLIMQSVTVSFVNSKGKDIVAFGSGNIGDAEFEILNENQTIFITRPRTQIP